MYLATVGDKSKVWIGLAGYVTLLVVTKSQEWGFPKDTGAEQIAALKDPTYNKHHLALHLALVILMGYTGLSVPAGGVRAKGA